MSLKTVIEQFEYSIRNLVIGKEGDVVHRSPATMDGVPFSADYLLRLALAGRQFIFGDADQNDAVLGQTSFANTTPTFLLSVPIGVTAIPLFLNLSQTGAVAGADIDFYVEYDFLDRFSTGGTAETGKNTNTGVPVSQRAPQCTFRSNATASAGFGMTVDRTTIAPDVSPAEGIVPGPKWIPPVPIILSGPASLLVYLLAGTTAPTVLWNFGCVELPSEWAGRLS